MALGIATTWPRSGLDLRAAALAGLVSGAVFMMWEMILVGIMEGSPWGPPRMIAAIAMGRDVLPQPGAAATFNLTVLIVAMIVHFVLAVIYAAILGWIVHRLSMGVSLAVGVAFGITLYIVNFYGFTELFPWFAMARNWIGVAGHAIFGLVAAWIYKLLAKEVRGVTTG